MSQFKKSYVLDTNVILDSPENLFTLSDKGTNLIVLPATVLDEIDAKKTGFEEINFNAREFNRLLTDAEVVTIINNDVYTLVVVKINEVVLHIIDLHHYQADSVNTSPSILNDRKILEAAAVYASLHENTIVVSNDIAFRIRALTRQLQAEPFKHNYRDTSKTVYTHTQDIDFDVPSSISTENLEKLLNTTLEPQISSVILTNTITGRVYIGVRINDTVDFIDDSSKRLDPDFTQLVRPQNIGQKVLAKLILSPFTDIVCVDAKAGCLVTGTQVKVEFEDTYKTPLELATTYNTTEFVIHEIAKWLNTPLVDGKYSSTLFTQKVVDWYTQYPAFCRNDAKYTSKYLKASYWVYTTHSAEFLFPKLRVFRRKYKHIFEREIDKLIAQGWNSENIHKTLDKIIFRFVTLKYHSLKDMPDYSDNPNTVKFYTFRGFSEEYALQKIIAKRRKDGILLSDIKNFVQNF